MLEATGGGVCGDTLSRKRDFAWTVSLRYGLVTRLVTGLVIVACDLYDTDSFWLAVTHLESYDYELRIGCA
jgi:hypothetical protein